MSLPKEPQRIHGPPLGCRGRPEARGSAGNRERAAPQHRPIAPPRTPGGWDARGLSSTRATSGQPHPHPVPGLSSSRRLDQGAPPAWPSPVPPDPPTNFHGALAACQTRCGAPEEAAEEESSGRPAPARAAPQRPARVCLKGPHIKENRHRGQRVSGRRCCASPTGRILPSYRFTARLDLALR